MQTVQAGVEDRCTATGRRFAETASRFHEALRRASPARAVPQMTQARAARTHHCELDASLNCIMVRACILTARAFTLNYAYMQPVCAQGAAAVARPQPQGRSPAELQGQLRRGGLLYYADARLVTYKERTDFRGGNGGKGPKQQQSAGGGGGSGPKHTYYLELLSGRERSAAYRCHMWHC